MPTNLYIIRHGEAYTNIESVIGGMQGDRGLTERGIAQAEALARRLSTGEIAADVLYASTLPRARATAEHVAAALKLPIAWDDELHELRPGESDGMRVEDARAKFAGFSTFLTRAIHADRTGRRELGQLPGPHIGRAGADHHAPPRSDDRGHRAWRHDRCLVPVHARTQARRHARAIHTKAKTPRSPIGGTSIRSAGRNGSWWPITIIGTCLS